MRVSYDLAASFCNSFALNAILHHAAPASVEYDIISATKVEKNLRFDSCCVSKTVFFISFSFQSLLSKSKRVVQGKRTKNVVGVVVMEKQPTGAAVT